MPQNTTYLILYLMSNNMPVIIADNIYIYRLTLYVISLFTDLYLR